MKNLIVVLFIITQAVVQTLVMTSCSSGPRVNSGEGGAATQKGTAPNAAAPGTSGTEQYGPPLTIEEAKPSYGPEPVNLKPLTLVFGPGMARSFAQIGVLRALQENKIPIGAIYGTELGSLIAAIYAVDSNINHFEWNLLRFKDDIFLANPGLIGSFFNRNEENVGDVSKLEDSLSATFGDKDLSETKLPLSIEIQRKGAGSPEVIKTGNINRVIRAAVSVPGLFTSAPLNGRPTLAATGRNAIIYLCVTARAQNGSPVILVDTATSASDPSAADLVIRPNLDGVGFYDFSKRNEIALRGKNATEALIPELKKWAGIPIDASEAQAQ